MTRPDVAQIAREYTAMGYRVHPLKPRSKEPETKWGHYTETPMTEAEILKWFGSGKQHNIGVATGSKSHLVAIDFDAPEAQGKFEATHGHKFPETYQIESRPGRTQLWFSTDATDIQSNKKVVQDDIDIRGEGGYVAAPGSIHPETGTLYRVSKDVPVVPLPEWCYSALPKVGDKKATRKKATTGEKVTTTGAGELGTAIPEGRRQDEIFKYACRLRGKGVSPAEAEVLVSSRWNDCKQPPEAATEFTLDEALFHCRDAYQRYLTNAEKDAAEEGDLLANVKTGTWLQTQEFPPLEWAVPDLIPEGFGVLAGPPKVGKSWLVLLFALSCASGGLALGSIPVKPRPVLYLALEDGHRRMKDRMNKLLMGGDFPANFEYLTRCEPDKVIPTIKAFMNKYEGEPVLVFLDTLGKCKPDKKAHQESYLADYKFGASLKDLTDAAPGTSLVGVHHTRKSEAEDFMETISGTQGLTGSVDFALVLKRKRKEKEGFLAITGRDVMENIYGVLCEDMRWTLDGLTLAEAAEIAEQRQEEQLVVKKASNIGDKTREALEFVQGRDQTTPKELAEHLGGDVDNKLAGQYLGRLEKQGLIAKPLDLMGNPRRGVYCPVPKKAEETEETEESACQDTNLTSSPVEERSTSEELKSPVSSSAEETSEGEEIEKVDLTSDDTVDSSLSSVSSPQEMMAALRVELLPEETAQPVPSLVEQPAHSADYDRTRRLILQCLADNPEGKTAGWIGEFKLTGKARKHRDAVLADLLAEGLVVLDGKVNRLVTIDDQTV